jgi:uncharacterized Zn finger protein (UPF0148 family)
VARHAYCSHCKEPLMRFADSESDFVVCPACGMTGDYKEVVEHGAGLTSRPFSAQRWNTIQKQWAVNKLHA